MKTLNHIKYLSLALIIFLAPACDKKFNDVVDKVKSLGKSSKSTPSSENTAPKNTIDISPDYASASSSLQSGYGLTYNYQNAFDGDKQTWWSPKGNYYDQWIQFNFYSPKTIHSIKILNGSHYPSFYYNGVYYGDLYTQNNILTGVRLEFSDSRSISINLAVYDGMQTVEFPECTTTFVKVYLQRVIPGRKWKDVCISEVKFN